MSKKVGYLLLLAVPAALLAYFLGASPLIIFAISAVSFIPLSYMLGEATEHLASRLGEKAGGLLNATFGNGAELIIAGVALNAGLLTIVRTSIVGSIISQLLLVLGSSIFLAGLRFRSLVFNRHLAEMNFTNLVLVLVAVVLPTMFNPYLKHTDASHLSLGVAVIIFFLYLISLFYSFRAKEHATEDEGDIGDTDGHWSVKKSIIFMIVSTGFIVAMAEILVGSIEPVLARTGMSEFFLGLIIIPIFGNVVDHIVAITTAVKNRMDLSVIISVGSAVQVAAFVLPIIVFLSFLLGRPFSFVFNTVEILAMGVSVFLLIPVMLDGKSNWLEGLQLISTYVILALVFWAL